MHPADDQRGELRFSPLETPSDLCPPQADEEFRFNELSIFSQADLIAISTVKAYIKLQKKKA